MTGNEGDGGCATRQADPRRALAEAERASRAMVASSNPPRSFMLAFVALVATLFTLMDRVSWAVNLGLVALAIPLGLWYFLLMRGRPRPRHPLRSSGAYVGFGLLLMAVLHGSGWWVPGSWAEVAVKWIVLFAGCWFCISRLQAMSVRDRLREAREKHV